MAQSGIYLGFLLQPSDLLVLKCTHQHPCQHATRDCQSYQGSHYRLWKLPAHGAHTALAGPHKYQAKVTIQLHRLHPLAPIPGQFLHLCPVRFDLSSIVQLMTTDKD